ncbi:MAG: hypothetical protein M3Q87_05060 [Actinomycetota bacterium]|nr:hypothetical protein [Actinomycetota bacterium]
MPPSAVRAVPPDPGEPTPAPPTSAALSIPAIRLRSPGWRDPRLAVGLVLVAIATVAGARLLTTSDDTAAVWVTTAPVRAGDDVADAELAPAEVALHDAADEATYLAADQAPNGVFGRDLTTGELVPLAAVDETVPTDRADVSLAVAVGDAPVDLAAGDLVDVYAVPDPTLTGPGRPGRADLLLDAVPVLTVRGGVALGDAAQQVVVGLDDSALTGPRTDLEDVLGTLAQGSPVLVRVGG